MLASASPALRRQLALQQPPYTVYIEGISGYLWQVILHFIYVGEMCPLNDFEAVAVTAAGTRLGMESLSRNATRFTWIDSDDADEDRSSSQKRRVSKTDDSEKGRVRVRRKVLRSSNNSAPTEYVVPSMTSLPNAARNMSTHSRINKDQFSNNQRENWYLPVVTSSSGESDIVQLVRRKADAKKAKAIDRVSPRSQRQANDWLKDSVSKEESSGSQDITDASNLPRPGTRNRVNLVFPVLPWRKAKAWHKFQRWLQYKKLAGSDSTLSTNSVPVQTSSDSNCHDIGMQTPLWQKRRREVSWEKTPRRTAIRPSRHKRTARNLCNHSSVNACNHSTTKCKAPKVKPHHTQHTQSNTQRKQFPFKSDACCLKKLFDDMTNTRMSSHFGHCHCARHHGRHVGMGSHGNNCHRTTGHSTSTYQGQRQPAVSPMSPSVHVTLRHPPVESARSQSVPARRRRPLLAPPRSCSLPDPERRWRHSGHSDPSTSHSDPPTGHFDTPAGHSDPPTGHFDTPAGHYDTPTGHSDPPTGHSGPPTGHYDPPTGHYGPPTGHYGPPTGHSCCHTPPAFTYPPNNNSSNTGQSESAANNNNPGLGSSLKRTSSRRACYCRDRKQRRYSKKQYPSGPGRESHTASQRYKCVPAVPNQYSSTDYESDPSQPGCSFRVGRSGTAAQQRTQRSPVDDFTSKQRYQPPTFTYSRHPSGLRPESVQQMTPTVGSPDREPAQYRRYNDTRKSSLDVFNRVQSSSGASVEPSPTRSNYTSLTLRRRTPTQEGRRTRGEGYVAGATDCAPSSAQSRPTPQTIRSSSSQCSASRSVNSVLTQSVKSIHWPPGVTDSSKAKLKKYKSMEAQWYDVVDASVRSACDNCPGSGPFNKTARQYTCIKCGSVFKSRRNYYRHMLDFHLNDPAH